MTHKHPLPWLVFALLLITNSAHGATPSPTPQSLCMGMTASLQQTCLTVAKNKLRSKQQSDAAIQQQYQNIFKNVSDWHDKAATSVSTPNKTTAVSQTPATAAPTTATASPSAHTATTTTPPVHYQTQQHPQTQSTTPPASQTTTPATTNSSTGFHISYD